MCGIAGFVDVRHPEEAQQSMQTAVAMASRLRHRGPDDSGVWTDPSAGIALAHRRLGILDVSPSGHQPMVSANARFVLVYNGEIYNHAELRAQLQSLGYAFRGHSDTEVLVEACAEWGVEGTLRKLRGMFAFALWDRAYRTLTLARDRLGIKPLFWARFGGLFLFASELKGLLAHPGWNPEIDDASVRAYMRWGHVPAPYSIYRGVHKLQPGEYLVARADAEPAIASYWDPAQAAAAAQADPFDMDEPQALGALEDLLDDTVARHMASDVPLGAFLSGGIDSSLIVALMRKHSQRPVHTFAIGFDDARYDEAPYARAVANHFGTVHTEAIVTAADAVSIVPEIPVYFDEPLAIRSQIPIVVLCRLARRDVTVALAGDGGDELFGGYPGYYIVRAVHRATSGLGPMGRRMVAGTIDGLVAGATRLQGKVPSGRRPELFANRIKQATAVVRDGGGICELYAQLYCTTAGRLPLRGSGAEHAMRWQHGRHRDVVGDSIDRMGYFALLGTLVDGSLAKIDRASMAHSLEVRVPYLDDRVVDFAWHLPPALKYAKGVGSKHLLRTLLHRHLPRELVDRPKKGFSSPLPTWLRGPLRDWADHLLDERALAEEGLFDAAAVRDCWRQHVTGVGDYWQLIWNVVVFRQWRSHWESARLCRSPAPDANPVRVAS